MYFRNTQQKKYIKSYLFTIEILKLPEKIMIFLAFFAPNVQFYKQNYFYMILNIKDIGKMNKFNFLNASFLLIAWLLFLFVLFLPKQSF